MVGGTRPRSMLEKAWRGFECNRPRTAPVVWSEVPGPACAPCCVMEYLPRYLGKVGCAGVKQRLRNASEALSEASVPVILSLQPKLPGGVLVSPPVSSGLGGPQTVPWPELAELEPLTSTHMQATHQTTHVMWSPRSASATGPSRSSLPTLLYVAPVPLVNLQLGRQKCPSQCEDEPVIIVTP